METENYNIITCDGGGFHGVITAMILDDLETSLPGTLEKVSLFGGTSTGAIISMGIASRLMMPKDLINFYETKGEEVFERYEPDFKLDICHIFPELCYPKYTNEGQMRALRPYLGDATLADLKTSALVTTFVISDEEDHIWSPLAIDNLPGSRFLNTKLLDAVMCSSSPPLFMPPYLLQTTPKRWCVDGAVFANNPTSFTMAHVVQAGVLEEGNLAQSNVRILSVGTGIRANRIPFDTFGSPFQWGIRKWLAPDPPDPIPAFPALTAFWDGQSEVDNFQAALIMGTERYRRANLILPQNLEIDDWQNVPLLQRWTKEYINTETWQSVKQWVKENFV